MKYKAMFTITIKLYGITFPVYLSQHKTHNDATYHVWKILKAIEDYIKNPTMEFSSVPIIGWKLSKQMEDSHNMVHKQFRSVLHFYCQVLNVPLNTFRLDAVPTLNEKTTVYSNIIVDGNKIPIVFIELSRS